MLTSHKWRSLVFTWEIFHSKRYYFDYWVWKVISDLLPRFSGAKKPYHRQYIRTGFPTTGILVYSLRLISSLPRFRKRHLWCILRMKSFCISSEISLKFVSRGPIDNPVGSDNGLVPNRRHDIFWTYADTFHGRIYAALGGEELIVWPLPITPSKRPLLLTYSRIITWAPTVKLPRAECHRTPPMKNQHLFWQWFGTTKQELPLPDHILNQIYVVIWHHQFTMS